MIYLTTPTPAGSTLMTEDYYVKQVSSGYDELIFEVSIWDPVAAYIVEDTQIEERSDALQANLYLVKAIDRGKNTMTVKCQIDLDPWKSAFYESYVPVPQTGETKVTPMDIVEAVCLDGWTVQGSAAYTAIDPELASFTYMTPLDILDAIRDVFPGLTYRFDNIMHKITVARTDSGTESGIFVSRDTNLRTTFYKGKSSSLITRLYATGKDGLTFASINDGKAYVDNTGYRADVIIGYWRATEYEDAADLLAAATARLAELAWPERSFDVDIAATDIGDYPLFAPVKISDETIPAKYYTGVVNRVAERWIHPDHPERNKIVLTTAPARIQSQVAALIKKAVR